MTAVELSRTPATPVLQSDRPTDPSAVKLKTALGTLVDPLSQNGTGRPGFPSLGGSDHQFGLSSSLGLPGGIPDTSPDFSPHDTPVSPEAGAFEPIPPSAGGAGTPPEPPGIITDFPDEEPEKEPTHVAGTALFSSIPDSVLHSHPLIEKAAGKTQEHATIDAFRHAFWHDVRGALGPPYGFLSLVHSFPDDPRSRSLFSSERMEGFIVSLEKVLDSIEEHPFFLSPPDDTDDQNILHSVRLYREKEQELLEISFAFADEDIGTWARRVADIFERIRMITDPEGLFSERDEGIAPEIAEDMPLATVFPEGTEGPSLREMIRTLVSHNPTARRFVEARSARVSDGRTAVVEEVSHALQILTTVCDFLDFSGQLPPAARRVFSSQSGHFRELWETFGIRFPFLFSFPESFAPDEIRSHLDTAYVQLDRASRNTDETIRALLPSVFSALSLLHQHNLSFPSIPEGDREEADVQALRTFLLSPRVFSVPTRYRMLTGSDELLSPRDAADVICRQTGRSAPETRHIISNRLSAGGESDVSAASLLFVFDVYSGIDAAARLSGWFITSTTLRQALPFSLIHAILDGRETGRTSLQKTLQDAILATYPGIPEPMLPKTPYETIPAHLVLDSFSRLFSSHRHAARALGAIRDYSLTSTEYALLCLTALLPGARAIADQTGMALKTLKNHFTSIYDKFQLHGEEEGDGDSGDSKSELLLLMAREGVIPEKILDALQKELSTLALDHLTSAEKRLVPLLGQGKANAQIAGELGLSENTVGNQMSRVFRVLGCIRPKASLLAFLISQQEETS